MPYSALLCDLDGTLVDSFADIRAGILRALVSVGGEPSEQLADYASRGISLEAFYGHAFGAPAKSEPARFTAFVDSYRDDYFTDFQSTAYPSVADTLAAIRGAHPDLPIAVATTKRTGMASEVVRRCGLADLVDHVLGSDNIPKKPNPTLLRNAAAAVNAAITDALMVGDTDNDILAARAAGCTAVGATYGGFDADEMRALSPDHVIDSFAELAALL